jgi:hypothetical protein
MTEHYLLVDMVDAGPHCFVNEIGNTLTEDMEEENIYIMYKSFVFLMILLDTRSFYGLRTLLLKLAVFRLLYHLHFVSTSKKLRLFWAKSVQISE